MTESNTSHNKAAWFRLGRYGVFALDAVFVGLVVAWIGCEVYHARSSAPPPPGIGGSYAMYREKMPEPVKVQKLTKSDKATPYFLAYGPIRAPLALASGPPVYVF